MIDIAQLKIDHDRAKRYTASINQFDPAECPKGYGNKIRLALIEIVKVFPRIFDMADLKYIYVFSPDDIELTSPLLYCDGMATWYTGRSGRKYGAIGISAWAIDRGYDRLYFVLLHEFCHLITTEGHTEAFHQYLDYLLLEFNQATDRHLVNDYQQD